MEALSFYSLPGFHLDTYFYEKRGEKTIRIACKNQKYEIQDTPGPTCDKNVSQMEIIIVNKNMSTILLGGAKQPQVFLASIWKRNEKD